MDNQVYIRFGTVLSSYDIESVVIEIKEDGVVRAYEDGEITFTSYDTLRYRLKIGDTRVVRY